MDQILKGEVALVTGSGRGLGHAVVSRLAEWGAHVAVHDISQEAPAEFGEAKNLDEVAARLTRFGVRTVGVTGDIGNPEAIVELVKRTEAALGPISILANVAGGDIAAKGGKPNPNENLFVAWEDVQAIFNRNLFGTMLCCRAVVPGMLERKRGAVINIGSGDAHTGHVNSGAYAVAKAAIVHYTRTLANQCREHNVRVNAVSPGATVTARFKATRTVDPKFLDESTPLLRFGKPEEVADAIAFLASPLSAHISGQVIRVDGGLQSWPG
ncbi:MAG: 2-hydroxycyclohexanecarboxyl-CoA dehydrogenase [Planctomycetota bacterium]|nr:SDR family oxidoreductase [Planctomycetota bacterium]